MSRARKSMRRALIVGAIASVVSGELFAGDELYRFSGRKAQQEPGQSAPQIQLKQEEVNAAKTNQRAGTSETPGTSILNETGGPPGTNQPPPGTEIPLPGGPGAKLGVGPVGPGGTSRATADPNEGPFRYWSRPPSWENLNETDAGRNRNAPGEGNTSVASGANIFGTSPVPFPVGPGNR